ncbi:polyprotein [Grand Arbaud virus]|uniref:Envelopment polyprotein n=1 Tax=Grand Arbaud virus TaxID=487098 RepID=L7NZ13_9VIRU|nr:polyprotein [Grand Arbaud virus]AFH08733.1 polyprotein [Grand Arbaud virus]
MGKYLFILLLLIPSTGAIFHQIIDASRRILEHPETTWRRDQPEHHSLTKSDHTTIPATQIVEKNATKDNFTRYLQNYRVYNCETGRNGLIMMDLHDRKFIRVHCNDNESFSQDCRMCSSPAPTIMKSKDLVYDDVICQSDYDNPSTLPQHDTKFCEVGPIRTSHCGTHSKSIQHVNWFWIDGQIRFIDEFSVSWIEGKFISLFDCKNSSEGSHSCNKTICLEGSCTGDVQFCTEFTCKLDSPACTCNRNKVTGVAMIHSKVGSFLPACFGRSMWAVKKHISKRSLNTGQLCSDCETSCKPNDIQVVVRHFDPDYYQACLGSTCLTGRAFSREFNIPFKMADRLSDAKLQISIWDKSKRNEYKINSYCEMIDACSAITCWFCRANWANIHCFSKEQILILVFAFALCIVAIASVLKALKVIVAVLWKILCPIVWVMSVIFRTILKIIRRKSSSIKESVYLMENGLKNEERFPMTSDLQVRTQKNGLSTREKMFQITRLNLTILGVICIATPAYGCSDSLSITASTQRCTTNHEGFTTCFVSTSSVLHVSPKGQESCLMIKNPSNQVVDVLRIRTESIKLECVKRDLYWVPRVTHQCLGVRRCHLMGDCVGEKCAAFRLTDYSPEWGHEEELMSRQGWSYCVEQCGGALCQCFNLRPSCFYLRKTFLPMSQDAYNMFECSEWNYKIEATFISNSTRSNITLQLGVPDAIPYGMVSLSTVSQPPSIAYSECFGEDQHGIKFHAVCNRRTDYTLGRLGEIQCPTKADALSVSRHCLTSESIILSKVHKDSVDCRSAIIDPQLILSKNKLPATIGSVTFWPTPGGIEAAVPNLASATLLLRLDGYYVQYKSDNNKCSARFLNVSGCYNCEAGAKLLIEHVTDFGSALGLLNCPELDYSTYFEVHQNIEKVYRTIHVNKSHLATTCSFKCPNSETTLTIQGELIYLFNDDVRHHNQSLSPGIAPKTGLGWDPFGWLKTSWFRILWALLGSTLSIIIGIVVIYLILNFCLKSKKS